MPLAQRYSANPQAQRSADVGPSPFEQLGPAFTNLAVNPQLKVFQYTVVAAAKGLPVIGTPLRFLEWVTDPVGELKKELDISPSVGGAIKESIISGVWGNVGKVLAVSSGLATGGQLSSDLVQRAVAYEYARKAQLASRNTPKFLVQEVWNGLIKGDWFFDRFIYDKKYLFHYDADGRAARWQANSIAQRFGLEGEEVKLGSHCFSTTNVDKSYALVPFLKAGKVGWQVLGPTLATAALFPPAAPLVFAWQALNADWGQFIDKHTYGVAPDPRLGDGRRKDADGNWVLDSSGKRYTWGEINEFTDARLKFKNQFFKSLDDFFTIRGWYRTFVSGETLRERGWKQRGHYNDWAVRFGHGQNDVNAGYKSISYYDPRRGNYVKHFNKNKGRNELRLPNGQVVRNLFRGGRVVEITGTNRFFQGAYRAQQFGSKIVAPVALAAFLAVNPVTAAIAPVAAVAAAFSVAKNWGNVFEPLKWLGWKTGIYNQMQFIQRYASRYGKIASLAHPLVFVLEENGSSFLRRWARRFYSVLSPFDRDVGIFGALTRWRDFQWGRVESALRPVIAGVLLKYPFLRKIVRFVRRLPGGRLVGVPLLGVAKWILAPGQALKDAIWNFSKWVAWKGFRFAFGHALRKWIFRPLTNLLLGWAKNLPAGSIRGRIVRFFLGKAFGAFRPPPVAKGLFGKIGSALGKLFSQLLKQIIGLIVRFLKFIFQKIVLWITSMIGKIAVKIAVAAGAPLWLAILVIGLVIFLVALIIFMIVVLALAFLSTMAPASAYQSPPVNSSLEIRKELNNPKPDGALFKAGELVEYSIKFRFKKRVREPITYEDRWLVAEPGASGAEKRYFKTGSFSCQEPGRSTTVLLGHPEITSGLWEGVGGPLSNGEPSEEWTEFVCSAQIDSIYTEGTLKNQLIISATTEDGQSKVFASQWLYVNGGSASGWPTEHGCFTQGPRTQGLFSSHKNQEAVDIGKNDKIRFPVDGAPVYSTITGKVLRVCHTGTYSQSTRAGVCGGIDEGSQFGPGFGTYVIFKERNTNLSIFYAHLGTVTVSEGDTIVKGGPIGFVDNTGTSTGPHLHYAFTKNSGAAMNQPFIPYYVPSCSGDFPDPSCEDAFKSIGEPGRVCF